MGLIVSFAAGNNKMPEDDNREDNGDTNFLVDFTSVEYICGVS